MINLILDSPGPPVFTIHPDPDVIMLPAGETIMLNCTVTGSPIPVLRWAKNRVVISDELPVIAISTSVLNFYTVQSNITIGPATFNISGSYHCLAEGETIHGQPLIISSNYTRLIFTCEIQYNGCVHILCNTSTMP